MLEARLHADGRVLRVEMPEAARVQLLLEDYAFFAADVERFCGLLGPLVELRGKETVQRWQAQARAGDWPGVFAALMREHYDPLYLRSIDRHFSGFSAAQTVTLDDGQAATLRAVASRLL